MSKAKQPDPPAKRFDKLVHEICDSGGRERWRIFSDFCEVAALSFANAFPGKGLDPDYDRREQRYLEIAKACGAEVMKGFVALLGIVTEALEDLEPRDILGDAFQRLELSSHWHGQFFTPMEVSRMMAAITLGGDGGMKRIIDEHGFATLMEPACGAGSMVIACASEFRKAGFNPQQQLHVTAQDVDSTAVHMAYIQFTLLGLPAVVIEGNSLTNERRDVFRTFQHWTGMWDGKLRRRRAAEASEPAAVAAAPAPQADVAQAEQATEIRAGQLTFF